MNEEMNEESLDDKMLNLIEQIEEPESEYDSDCNSLFESDDESEASYVFESMYLTIDYNGKDVNEIAAAGVSTTIDTSLLKRDEIWIADRGCTTHMTPHKNGMIKTSKNLRGSQWQTEALKAPI